MNTKCVSSFDHNLHFGIYFRVALSTLHKNFNDIYNSLVNKERTATNNNRKKEGLNFSSFVFLNSPKGQTKTDYDDPFELCSNKH